VIVRVGEGPQVAVRVGGGVGGRASQMVLRISQVSQPGKLNRMIKVKVP
jgi:hypothetical protein